MKWNTLAMLVAVAMVLTDTRAMAAGDLAPSGPPAPTMHSLEELYQKQTALEARLAALEQRMAADGMAATVDGMVLIPAGDFPMGENFAEGYPQESPVHKVTTSAFLMDQYEVTRALWNEVARWGVTNGYDLADTIGWVKHSSHPMCSNTWYSCVKWANARSQMENRVPCYYTGADTTTVYKAGILDIENDWVRWDADGYRLPTEAEWEKAARGGVAHRRFPWADSNLIDHYRANYESLPSSVSYDTSIVQDYHPAFNTGADDKPYTSPVGSFAPNGYGLYDMAGNVWEWCWDWYNSSYYGQSPRTDPRGPEASSSIRIMRGGAWEGHPFECRAAYRAGVMPAHRYYGSGLRTVRIAE